MSHHPPLSIFLLRFRTTNHGGVDVFERKKRFSGMSMDWFIKFIGKQFFTCLYHVIMGLSCEIFPQTNQLMNVLKTC